MFSSDDCDECLPDYLRPTSLLRLSSLLTFAPFLITFTVVFAVALSKLFPRLAGTSTASSRRSNDETRVHAREEVAGPSRRPSPGSWFTKQSMAAVTFSASFALSIMLVELILCEISGSLDPRARSATLRLSLPALIFLLLVAAPALEIHSIIATASWGISSRTGSSARAAWVLECVGLTVWLFGFWYCGAAMLDLYSSRDGVRLNDSAGLVAALLSRVGVFGISMMASLAGFAAVSALWQTFGSQPPPVSEADIARKQAGMNATCELLAAKESRLRALNRKMSESPATGVFSRVWSAVRTSPDTQELRLLRLEIAGLEATRYSLGDQILALQARRGVQLRGHTALGRLLHTTSFLFAIYCGYRLVTATLSTFHRTVAPASTPSTSSATDPVTQTLALLAKLWDPTLDRALWSRQLSFLLSGGMLLASLSSALQTFLLLARAFPALVRLVRANFALLVGQVCGTYVIASALLLRGHLPADVGGAVAGMLGAPLEPKLVEAWFDGWFLLACAVTAVGIWVGRRVTGDWDGPDEGGVWGVDLEMGKMN